MLKIKKQKHNAVLISADSQEELADSFMRFQEFYENPHWADKIFTVGQVKKWYSEKYGADTYRFDWHGFNFPSCVLKPFKEGLFDPLTENEHKILSFLKYRNDNFYVIGSNTDDVLKHELNHALYYTNKKYREETNNLIDSNKKQLKNVFSHILKLGYHKKVLYDETQAYCLDDGYFEKHKINLSPNFVSKLKILNEKFSK
jgi:hypothetical protein